MHAENEKLVWILCREYKRYWWWGIGKASSEACLWRRSHCHKFSPSRSVVSASLRSRQSKIHRLQVGLHGSEPGLPWTTNPLSPVVRLCRPVELGDDPVRGRHGRDVQWKTDNGCGQCLTEMAFLSHKVRHFLQMTLTVSLHTDPGYKPNL